VSKRVTNWSLFLYELNQKIYRVSLVTVVISTLRWAVLTVLWIGFCHTGPISLCTDSFVFICVYFVFIFFIRHLCCIIDCVHHAVSIGSQLFVSCVHCLYVADPVGEQRTEVVVWRMAGNVSWSKEQQQTCVVITIQFIVRHRPIGLLKCVTWVMWAGVSCGVFNRLSYYSVYNSSRLNRGLFLHFYCKPLQCLYINTCPRSDGRIRADKVLGSETEWVSALCRLRGKEFTTVTEILHQCYVCIYVCMRKFIRRESPSSYNLSNHECAPV